MQYKTLYNNNILHALEGTSLQGVIYEAIRDAVQDELEILESSDIEEFDDAIEELDSLAFDLTSALETELSYSL
jgi:flagellin-specific chaperone FliS